jgi:hypothetical protein
MSADMHVRVRRLVVPAPDEGGEQLRVRDVIEAIEWHLHDESRDSRIAIDRAPGSTASRIGEAVGHAVRVSRPSGTST